jgi:NADPH:quinone reductase-like Zn-dependent oxidoreductase
VLSTTRQAGRLAFLKEQGAGHPLLDTGQIAPAVRELYPDGVDAALDLVGTPTLPDTLRAVRVHGTACFSGSLSNQWTVPDFAPNEYLPKGVRLAGYPATPPTCPRRPSGDPRRGRGRPAVLPRGPGLRRPGAGAAGPRRHGA